MAAMSVLFAQQMQSPAYNIVQGPLLQLLLIQTQYMKRELLRQMHALDTLLRENFFTASMSALLPGVLAFGGVFTLISRLLRKLRSRRRSRRSLVKQVRSVMRDAERLLIRNIASRRRGGGGAAAPAGAHQSDVDTRVLVLATSSARRSSGTRSSSAGARLLLRGPRGL